MSCSLHFFRHAFHLQGTHVDWHKHAVHEIVYYCAGSGTTDFNGKRFAYQPGTFTVLPPYELHNEIHGTETEVMYFCFEYNGVGPKLTPGLYRDQSRAVFPWLTQIQHELNKKNYHYELAVNNLLQLLLIEVQRISGETSPISRNRQIQYAQRYMEQYYNQRIELSQLADISGYSSDHFRRLFKEVTGLTPAQYLRQLRISKSKEMIMEGDKTLTHIALDCGFASLSQYSGIFRQITGVRPTEYQKQAASRNAALPGSTKPHRK